MKEEKDKSKNLQTVERALDVLYLFHKYDGITLSFVAEKMNMSTTVAYRLLHTLTFSGFPPFHISIFRIFIDRVALVIYG